MSLRFKIVLILLLVLVAYVSVDLLINRSILRPSFDSLEYQEAQKDLERCVFSLRREIDHIDGFCHDWAAWDDTAIFVQDRNKEFEEVNLIVDSFYNNHLNLIYLLDTQGNVVWGRGYNLRTASDIPIKELPAQGQWPSNHPLMTLIEKAKSPTVQLEKLCIKGIYVTDQGPFLLSARPILTSSNEGPVQGVMVMGRMLDEDQEDLLARQTFVEMNLRPFQSHDPLDQSLADLTQKQEVQVEKTIDVLTLKTVLLDIEKRPAIVLSANVHREISQSGRSALLFASVSMMLSGAVTLIVLMFLIRNVILKPLESLVQQVCSVRLSPDLVWTKHSLGHDEIGLLGAHFNRTLLRLERSRKDLMDQSYAAGRAEYASGIMHNVCNSLTPISEHLEKLHEMICWAGEPAHVKAAKELTEADNLTARQKDLCRYLELSAQQCQQNMHASISRLKSIREQLGFIESIILKFDGAQETGRRFLENIYLDEVVGEAQRLLPLSDQNGIVLELSPQLKRTAPVRAERVVLKQIFFNLLKNAADAIRQASVREGVVKILAQREYEDGHDYLHVQVVDNGVGMSPQVLENVLKRGFTTKEDGHLGIGLHWTATALNAMGGRIWLESGGLGEGTAVHITLPCVAVNESNLLVKT